MATKIDSPLLTRSQAAEFLGVRPQTLALWGMTGKYGLPLIRIGGRCVRYRKSDLETFIASRVVGG